MKDLTKQAINKQTGFTLIELVVVIVILGILAVTAAPKFINLQDDARTATLQAVKASMESAATMIYSKSLIKGNETLAGGATAVVKVDGNVDILVRYGYPRHIAATLVTWQNNLLDMDDFTIINGNGGIVIHPSDRTLSGGWPADILNPTSTERNCYVRYIESTGLGVKPEIVVSPCV